MRRSRYVVVEWTQGAPEALLVEVSHFSERALPSIRTLKLGVPLSWGHREVRETAAHEFSIGLHCVAVMEVANG